MKVRITCNSNHWLGKEIASMYNADFYSRSTGWDIHNDEDIKNFCESTKDYDLTINFGVGYGFRASKLLIDLYQYCNEKKLNHTVLNIGSYLGTAVLNNPSGSYDLEKQLLKLTNKKINFDHAYFTSYLDSKILNLGHIEGTEELKSYPHLNGLTIESIKAHVKIIIDNPFIKSLDVQSRQPGMHRINEGKGPIFRGVY
jgi:hypothetical protein